MIAAAVNCLVTEPSRKTVSGVIGRPHSISASPKPATYGACPPWRTPTAAPGPPGSMRPCTTASNLLVMPRPPPNLAVRRRVDDAGELHVPLGDAVRFMCRQHDLDAVVDVRPFRMVVHLLRRQRHPGHEAEGRVEIGELEALGDRLAARDGAPAAQLRQRLIDGDFRRRRHG